jgi:hypothetical protein
MKKKCVIKTKTGFEVSYYEGQDIPIDFAIEHPPFNSRGGLYYQIAETDVAVQWTYGSYQGNKICFSFDGVRFKTINSPQINSICDYMNKFAYCTKEELEKLKIQAQSTAKSNLESELEELEEKKKVLQVEINKLIKIQSKKKELDNLLDQISLMR